MGASLTRTTSSALDAGGARADDVGGEPPEGSPVTVCVIASSDARTSLERTLGAAGYVVGGPDAASSATVVIVEAEAGDPVATVRRHRLTCRPDAATIVVLSRSCPPDSIRAASEAGAFACLRPSLAPADVEGVVAAATAACAADAGIADRSRPLDLESHLTSLGRFTAGLLHELKNPLAVVEMNVNLLRDDIALLLEGREHVGALLPHATDAHPTHVAAGEFLRASAPAAGDLEAALDDARNGLDRIRVLLGRLHGFVSKDEPLLGAVDLAAVVDDVCGELAAATAEVDLEVVDECGVPAFAARDHVEEIIRNLLSNALRAARTLSSPRVQVRVFARGTNHVVVAVRDNGPGIARDAQETIFEPFNSRRREDGAAGLGLALCREYAAHMGAQLSVWSVPGRGACFELQLRRATRRA